MRKQYFFLLLIVMMQGCAGGDPVFLRLKYKVGDEMTVTATFDSKSDIMPLKKYMEVKYRVTAIRDTTIDFDVDVLRWKLYYPLFRGVKLHYDSAGDFAEMTEEEKAMHLLYTAYYDTTLKLSISNRGEVTSPLSTLENIPAELPSHFGFVQLDARAFQVIFPSDTIITGKKWEQMAVIPFVPGTELMTYNVKQVTPYSVVVAMEGRVRMGLGMDVQAEYLLDATTHRLKSARFEFGSGDKEDRMVTVVRVN